MKLKFDFMFQKYDQKYMAVPDFDFKDKNLRFLWVNESGKTIMQLLRNEISFENLVEEVKKIYNGESEVIENAVREFTNQLNENGFLV